MIIKLKFIWVYGDDDGKGCGGGAWRLYSVECDENLSLDVWMNGYTHIFWFLACGF